MREGTHLRALEGTNPLGFLAALGVQVLFDADPHQPKLWWSDDVIPHAVVDTEYSLKRVVDQALRVLPIWAESPALSPGLGTKADNTGKFSPQDLTKYLERTRSPFAGSRFATALVTEGSLDGAGKVAKPTDLYFTAGQLKFLKIARQTLTEVDRDNVVEGLTGPWSYSSSLSSLGWDTTDDRIYALSAANPAKEKKLTNPGAEALAILGLSRHPVYTGQDPRGRYRTLTQGCAGPWRHGGTYTWPLWTQPATPNAVRSLLAHATGDLDKRSNSFHGWGISSIMRSVIRRSNQGGYGTFGPPEIVWSRD
ncbi:MAG: hypothetical protein F4Y40_10045 [Acidimicrobiia bacterium]|nr:hypothetical protein [Acidimicrobiia bacterium]